MITLVWYLLKVILCSGILCGYYFLALRNKAFHRWNRFYLLAAVVISLIVPVMKINIFQNNKDEGTVVQMLQTISYGDEVVIEYSKNSGFQINTENLAEAAYLLVSVIFLLIFFVSLYKIKTLKKKYPETKIEDISFISTNAKGTPFSFFKSIFWNNAIDLHSKSGQQIFNHEIAHVKEKHSYDKIFMNIVLIFFWINPFFWLMRKELYIIHEFIADKEALEDSDINSFAEMVLQTVYPGRNFSIGNSFFYSPLKRRIMMLTKNKNPKVSYISRLLVLPLAAIVFFAFTLKVNSSQSINAYDGKTITVVIDAGHGGDDNGAHSANGLKEKNITLSIAKKIAALNSNEHINILLSRDNDQSIPVRDRVHFAKDHHADLFVSIHVNGSSDEKLNGFSVVVRRNTIEKNQLLASALINELEKSYKTEDKIAIRNKGLVVVDSNSCPAAVVECGYMTNPNDVAFISKDANQEKIAKDILAAINNYAFSAQNENNKEDTDTNLSPAFKDSVPSMHYKGKEVRNISVQSKSKKIKVTEPVIKVTYQDGSTEMISKNEADKRGFVLPPPPPPGLPPSYFKSNALFVIDGKISTSQKGKELNPNNIESIDILKGNKATDKYGEKGKNGVIEINTKYNIPENTSIIIDGKESTREDLEKIKPGNIESFTILKDDSSAMKYGMPPREVIKVKTKKNLSSVSLRDSVPDKVFTKVEVESQFPGGLQAWSRYITRAISKNISKFTESDYGTCIIRFIVDEHGSVSDVAATTMKGTELAKVSVNAIKNGPKWIPASQNGKPVAAYRLQPVTLHSPKDNKKTAKGNGTVFHGDAKAIHGISSNNQKNSVPDKVFTKVEVAASFPGGLQAWSRYITRAIRDSISKFTKADYGTCVIRFIVNVDGKVSDVTATTMKGTELAKVSVNAIENGPKWIPASQNGHTVAAYRLQPVTLYSPDSKSSSNSTESNKKSTAVNTPKDPDMIFTKLEKTASFPGGQPAWLKYISRVIQKNGNELIADKNSEGTCKVRFIVSKDGKVSDVKAVTKQGSQLADVAINAIKNGPKWIPGTQNGHTVNSYVIQSVRFALNDNVSLKYEPE